jgi:hypothetical protein
VVLGASASAGHGTGAEIEKYGDDVPLSEVLRAMIRAESARITDLADELFLIAPESTATAMIDKAMASKPSCVIAIDFLFWFGYGNVKSLELRQRRLTKGLDLLARLECPLIICELPDMRRSVEAGRLHAGRVPDPKSLAALNRRISAWAGSRENVLVAPLREVLADLCAGKTVTVGGTTWEPPQAQRRLLQADLLHPTVVGLGMTAALSLQALAEKKLVAADALQLDAEAAAKRVIAARRRPASKGKRP